MSSLIDYIRETWYEVPDEATIPLDMEFVVMWRTQRAVSHIAAGERGVHERGPHWGYPRFTPEPLPESLPVEPDFEPPTTPGALVIAHDSEDETRRVFLRSSTDYWVDPDGLYRDDMLIDPQPATVIPTETWDRLRVLDPEDKRDRVDRDGDLLKFTTYSKEVWGTKLGAWNSRYGPLRFADEGGVLDD